MLEMKHVLLVALLASVPMALAAETALKEKLVGFWWGTMKITSRSKVDWDRHWIIERTADGRFRMQEYMVDPIRKVYASLSENPLTGSWRILEGPLLNYNGGPGRIWSDSIQIKDGAVVWEGGSMSGPQVDWTCTEVSVKKFAPKLNDGYRLLPAAQFRGRTKNNGEQSGTGQPATRPESKPEGGQKPQPKSEGRSR